MISGLYVSDSLIGMVYLFQFFRRFRLNVLQFTDASDFLMVVVREPATIALALLGIPLYWVYMGTTMPWWYRAQKRWPILRGDPTKFEARRAQQRKLVPYMKVGFVLVYAMLFMLLYSAWQARRVRSGRYPIVTFEFKTEMGTTSRFLLIYRPETRR